MKKRYVEKIVFENYNFFVDDNEYVIIIGKSGQGKSTLLNIIGLLDNDFEGDVFWEERNIKKMKDIEKSKIRNELIGFIFQNYNLLEDLNVIENIYLPYCYSKKKLDTNNKQIICNLMEELGIIDLSNKKVKHLSGGEKQRVAIARALSLNPKLILADEPTGNLDEESTHIVLDFFSKMKKEGKSIVMVTHNLNIIDKCDRVVDLSGGELLHGNKDNSKYVS